MPWTVQLGNGQGILGHSDTSRCVSWGCSWENHQPWFRNLPFFCLFHPSGVKCHARKFLGRFLNEIEQNWTVYCENIAAAIVHALLLDFFPPKINNSFWCPIFSITKELGSGSTSKMSTKGEIPRCMLLLFSITMETFIISLKKIRRERIAKC